MSPFPLTNTPSNKNYFFNDTVFWKQKTRIHASRRWYLSM